MYTYLRKEKHQLEFSCFVSLLDIPESHCIGVQTQPYTTVQPCFHFYHSPIRTLQERLYSIYSRSLTHQAHSYSFTFFTRCSSSAGNTISHLHHLPDFLLHFQVQFDLPCSKKLPLDQVYLVLWSPTNTYYQITHYVHANFAYLTTGLRAMWAAGIPVALYSTAQNRAEMSWVLFKWGKGHFSN